MRDTPKEFMEKELAARGMTSYDSGNVLIYSATPGLPTERNKTITLERNGNGKVITGTPSLNCYF